MKLSKCFKYALLMVLHSKIRSWLTILGIVIGVASVIAIMSIGTGLRQTVTSQLGNLGSDLITLTAGSLRGTNIFGPMREGRDFFVSTGASASKEQPKLTRLDVQVLKSIPEISLIDTQISGNVNVSYFGKSGSVRLTGVDQKVWSRITTLKIKEGRFLNSGDQNVIVIGGRLSETYFGKKLGINQILLIESNVFRVVGIIDDQSTNIYMPLNIAYQVLDNKETNVYDTIIMKVNDESQLNEIINKTTKKLINSRHVTEKTQDFSITSNAQISATRTSMMSTMNNFLIAIAAVSLIVGAVGIANTMFTSVLEKTKEIGIMKAIGARNRDILTIFLMNAALIGVVGGFLGVFFGIILSAALPSLVGETNFLREGTFVSLHSILVAMIVSVLISMLAGLIPAYQASKLKPVDALRFE